MATYAIGDVQGCFDTLQALLDEISFDAAKDRLWFAGDLVNRGPKSLEVLRFVRELGDAAVCVLGNHDLNLLAVDAGARQPDRRDTLDAILEADDREDLLGWMRSLPLCHREDGWLMVHAGLHPSWDAQTCAKEATRVQRFLRSDGWEDMWRRSRKNPPAWSKRAPKEERAAAALAILISVRCMRKTGELCMFSGEPDQAPAGCRPWYAQRTNPVGAEVIFGHWAALGGLEDREQGLHGLDTGCVWGRKLTALRLGDRRRFSVAARD